MDYIISRYVYSFITSRKEYLLYCSRTNSFLKLTKELYEFISECKNKPSIIDYLDNDVKEILKTHKIIINKESDQDFLLEHQIMTDKVSYSKTILGLTLVPTTACNFDCPYCFEDYKMSKTMNDEVIDNLLHFLKLHVESQFMDITWYGGEPLLAFNTIKKILGRIESEIALPIRMHSIITNGYYFNLKVINFFKKYPLNSIQITLDGNRERHNSIRKQKHTGEGSYDKLIQNIDNILIELPETRVSLRINIEKKNIQDFFEIQKELSKRWKDKNINIYPGMLRIDNNERTALSCDSLSHTEINELIFNLRSQDILKLPIYPTLNYKKNCCATILNSFIIGPKGEFYKCWNDVSDNSKIIGYINKEKLTNPTLLHRYIVGSKWYHNKECVECFFLPICKGSCAFYRLRDIYNDANYNMCNCMQKSPQMLDKSLEYYYYNKQKMQTV